MAVITGRLALSALGLVSAVAGFPPVEPASGLGSEELARLYGIPQPHIKGVPSLIKFQDPLPELLKRDCLGNGTNYCFNNNANYCASCGICCGTSSSRYCCPADGICCGSSCCGKGQTCNNGQCYQSPVTVTSASTVLQTVTHSRTQINTVVTTILLTSTINSVIESTITSAATETNWQYVTVTTSIGNAKRSVPTAASAEDGESPDVVDALLQVLYAEQPVDLKKRRLGPRQEATRTPASAVAATTTVEATVTSKKDVTSVITTEVASTQTSTVLKPVFQTRTKVLSAQTTISPTSTLTITIYPPTTTYQTIIATAIVDPTPNPTTTDPSLQTQAPSTNPSGLNTPTIAGIGAGSAVFALVLALSVFFFIKHRRAAAARKQAYEDACLGLHDDDAYVGPGYGHMSLPPVAQAHPTLPVVDEDDDDTHGAHKASFTSTAVSATSTTPHSMTQAKFQNKPGHNRSSSGFTGSTAVTSTNAMAARRASELSGRSVAGGTPPAAAEMGEQQQQTPQQTPQQPYLQELYDNEDHQWRESHQHHPAEMMADDTARYEVEGEGAWYGGHVDGVHNTGYNGTSGRPSGGGAPAYRDF